MVNEKKLCHPAGSRDPGSSRTPGPWLPQPFLPRWWLHRTSQGGALQGGLAARREEVTVTPGYLELAEEWAQKPG